MKTILVVDDAPNIVELLRLYLEGAGYATVVATDGPAAVELHRKHRPDLVVLDLMLPDVPGTEVCRRLRTDAELGTVPILMLTARSEEIDRVVGLELGADDYVTKPFSPRELVLRARAILRRTRADGDPAKLMRSGLLELDPERHRCRVSEQDIKLTAKEFELLRALMERPGRVMTRDRLLDEVWGSDITVTSRTIDTHLKRLREKLGDAGDLVETVRGVGYRFAD